MPNWCENKMIITADNKDDLTAFITKYCDKDGDFDFNKVIPQPTTPDECADEFIIRDEADARKHYLSYEGDMKWFNWYDWNRMNWGTKWNADNSYISNSDDSLTIDFLTAWSPSIPIVEKLMELEPKLKISYYFLEEGCGFCGGIDSNGYYESVDSADIKGMACDIFGHDEDDYDDDYGDGD